MPLGAIGAGLGGLGSLAPLIGTLLERFKWHYCGWRRDDGSVTVGRAGVIDVTFTEARDELPAAPQKLITDGDT